jgi:putative nucleotidyltransferase with HDIG domain
MTHQDLVRQLDALLRETYALWDQGWVTFNWRNYTYDHVQRVRGLAMTLAAQEGGDLIVTELGALLHDLTKPYDGEYATGPDGKRLVDERGFWYNEPRLPARHNAVTRLYDDLGLTGRLHNESGAELARRLLDELGVPPEVVARTAAVIADHLIPPAEASMEARCLYDADTIDANIGLPAFVRNIYINLHFYDQRRGAAEPPIAETLASDPLRFLGPYIRENLPRWARGKRQDFVPKLTTAAGREVAIARLDRLDALFGELGADLETLSPGVDHSRIDLVLHYMRHTDDPRVWDETEHLHRAWQLASAPGPSLQLLAALRAEMLGEI